MSLVLTSDFSTHLYASIIAKIDRNSDGLLQTAIDTAEERVKGSMGRFDISTLFSATDDSRSAFLMKLIKDIAAWEFLTVGNANVDLSIFRSRYEDAIAELDKLVNGKLLPDGWPLVSTPSNQKDFFDVVNTSDRRETRF